MTDAPFREIWLPLLKDGGDECMTLDRQQALTGKGAETMLRIGLFKSFGALSEDDPGEFYNIANIIAFILKISSASYAGGGDLLDTSSAPHIAACAAAGLLPVEFLPDATETQFINRERAPINIYLPSSATANLTAGTLYAVFTGATSDRATQNDWWGYGRFISKDIGLGVVPVAPAQAELYVRSDVFQAADASNVKFGKNKPGRTATFVSRNGRKGRTLGCDDNGQGAGNLENY